jgi:hypothetical protein
MPFCPSPQVVLDSKKLASRDLSSTSQSTTSTNRVAPGCDSQVATSQELVILDRHMRKALFRWTEPGLTIQYHYFEEISLDVTTMPTKFVSGGMKYHIVYHSWQHNLHQQ